MADNRQDKTRRIEYARGLIEQATRELSGINFPHRLQPASDLMSARAKLQTIAHQLRIPLRADKAIRASVR